ncbi:chemotaxis protein CheA [Halobacillus sp. ACCC02827]|uniref:chemotaxis protein CheA n=1 Tax=Halobacillus sp. ACCC02827 TaxID=3052090 RepID=UPI00256FBC68|nr:chemotaxis protein CheA [Halobacillus sp. ACCC02827]WJE17487.1 chemotaxis protein CheA [Halobacillus sp. ACCC02827]
MEMNQYLEVFLDESREHLQAINDHLLVLEKNPEDLSIVNEIFRSAHTLKGMSATMGYQDLSDLTHKMENVLDAVRNGNIIVDGPVLDVVFDSVDDLEAMVVDIANGGNGERDVQKVVRMLQSIEEGTAAGQLDEAAATTADPLPEQGLPKVDEYTSAVLRQAEEQGHINYEVRVRLREDCLLKSVRVFMIFEVLEQMGEVLQTNPSAEDLENEAFEEQFTVLLTTTEPAEEVKEKILQVSEVEQVDVSPYELPEQKAQEIKEVRKEETKEELESEKKQIGNKTIRINIDRLDALMNLFEELVIDRGRLEQISNEMKHDELQETVERMVRISGDLQSIILNMRMVPVEQVFNRFPRMVRQLSRDLHKEIHLSILGAETELDRTVIDEIGDPLVHLIRNALDHGIESPEIRTAQGKPPAGSLELKAYHSGNHVFIEITDDGAGINRDKVIEKAVGNRIITREQAETMTDSEVFELIMASGFSTADTISDVSGRGVGLDVVKNTIESLGGAITIESVSGEGSRFSIQLPLTLSIISVMLVEVQEEKYAIPLSSIIETAIVKKEDILHAHNKKVIDFRGRVVPLVFLKDILHVPESLEEKEHYSVVIVRKGEKMAALVVNTFIGQQEVVLKSLGEYLSGVFAISGATILGDGQVALILDSNALIK